MNFATRPSFNGVSTFDNKALFPVAHNFSKAFTKVQFSKKSQSFVQSQIVVTVISSKFTSYSSTLTNLDRLSLTVSLSTVVNIRQRVNKQTLGSREKHWGTKQGKIDKRKVRSVEN